MSSNAEKIREASARRAAAARRGREKRPAIARGDGADPKRRRLQGGSSSAAEGGEEPGATSARQTSPPPSDQPVGPNVAEGTSRAQGVSGGVVFPAASSGGPVTEEASPIYAPRWGVREGSSIRDRSTALEIGAHSITPFDREYFSRVKFEDLASCAQVWAGQMVGGVNGLIDKVRARNAEIARLKAELDQREAAMADKEAALQASRAALEMIKDQLGRTEEGLRASKEELNFKEAQVRSLQEEQGRHKVELREAAERTIEEYKGSAAFLDELMTAYATCWEDAAALCRENGQEELAIVMDQKAEDNRFQPEEAIEGGEAAEEGGEGSGPFPDVPGDLEPLPVSELGGLTDIPEFSEGGGAAE